MKPRIPHLEEERKDMPDRNMRPLYLDAQATTPLVSYGNSVIDFWSSLKSGVLSFLLFD